MSDVFKVKALLGLCVLNTVWMSDVYADVDAQVVRVFGAQAGAQLRAENPKAHYILYVGSFQQHANAARYQARLQRQLVNSVPVQIKQHNGYYVVFIGPIQNGALLKQVSQQVLTLSKSTSTSVRELTPAVQHSADANKPWFQFAPLFTVKPVVQKSAPATSVIQTKATTQFVKSKDKPRVATPAATAKPAKSLNPFGVFLRPFGQKSASVTAVSQTKASHQKIRPMHASDKKMVAPVTSAPAKSLNPFGIFLRPFGQKSASVTAVTQTKVANQTKVVNQTVKSHQVPDKQPVVRVNTASVHTLNPIESLSPKLREMPNNSLLDNWRVAVGVGPSWYQAGNTAMDVTTTDINLEVVSGVNTTALYRAGIGYPLLQPASFNRNYLNQLLLELNYYYVHTTVNGEAWDYLSSNSNNYSFSAPLNSSRLMLDLKPTLMTWRGISSYFIVGGGAAWNQMSYAEAARSSEFAVGVITLPIQTTQTLAYDLGVGFECAVTEHARISLDYLYTSLGHASPSPYSKTPQSIVSPPIFSVKSNTLMANLAWVF